MEPTRERAEAEAICKAVEEELKAGTEETIALARGRGHQVDQGIGPIRIRDHDGLLSLTQIKDEDKITADQYDAGLVFREAWELRIIMGSQMGGIGHIGSPTYDNAGMVWSGVQRAKKLQALGSWINAVSKHRNPMALTMLQEVAGNAKALSTFGQGSTFYANLAALKAALDIINEIRGVGEKSD